MPLRHIALVLLLFWAGGLFGGGASKAAGPHVDDGAPVDLVFFYGQGCPHCAAIGQFLQSMDKKYPQLRVHTYEVYFNPNNARLLERMAAAYGTRVEGVPTLFLSNEAIVGFGPEMQTDIEQKIAACIQGSCASPLTRVAGSLPGQTLTFSAVVLGAAVDAINPCEFAVLIILITTVLAARGRRQALYAGLAFSLSIFISYYLMGLGAYSAIQAAGLTRWLQLVLAILAILIGLSNLKDFFWYGKIFLMEVPLTWRPALKGAIQRVTSAPGAFLTGFVVSLFLLPCTSGPYIVILGLLANTTTRVSALLWLLLYNLIFITPMLAITVAVHFGLTTAEQAEVWRTRHLRLLHLIAGMIVLSLGLAILVLLWFGYL